LRNLAQLTC